MPEAASYSIAQTAVLPIKAKNGDVYRIMVAWPDGEPPAAGWPVLYVLDGEDNFAVAALTARRLARARDRSGVDAGLVVGIEAGPLARRVRDYTPATPGWAIPQGAPASGLPTGGADEFATMVEQKVMPLVRSRWRIDQARETLLGHSFGGLLGLHVGLTRPTLFDSVVAVSPSLWFGGGTIIREAEAAATTPRFLIAEGEVPSTGPLSSPGGPQAVVDQLSVRPNGGTAKFLPLPGQGHGSTMLAAMAPAITFAFGKDTR